MVMRSATKGFSLVECLVASALGVIAIGMMGSVFLSAQKAAQARSQQLYLQQALTRASQTIEDDLRRAGFNHYQGEVLTLASSSVVVELAAADDFALAYYREMADNRHYRNVRYYLTDGKLVVCEQGVLDPDDMMARLTISSCRSMLDERVLQVTSFALSALPLASSKATSSFWQLSVSAQTKDLRYAQTLTTNIKQRNWQ